MREKEINFQIVIDVLVSFLRILLGGKPESEIDRLVERAIAKVAYVRVFVEALQPFIRIVRRNETGDSQSSTQGPTKAAKEDEPYRMYRPTIGWRNISAEVRKKILANPSAYPLLVDRPSGHGPDSVWLYGKMVRLTRFEFAFLCLICSRAKLHRDSLSALFAREIGVRDYLQSDTATETLKSATEKQMNTAGHFKIHGADRLYELKEPNDYVFIDYSRFSTEGTTSGNY